MDKGARDDLLAGPADSAAAPADNKRSGARNLIEWVVIIGGALLAAFLVKTFLFQAFYIPSGSMEPTLQIGDRVLVSKLSYRLGEIDRGDLIVFKRPDLPAGTEAAVKDLIKRVIALPGETVETRDGSVYINGKELDEEYLPDGTYSDNVPRQEIPEGTIWVMGDNRGNSRDSRVLGPVSIDSIHGRAFVRIWPVGDISTL